MAETKDMDFGMLKEGLEVFSQLVKQFVQMLKGFIEGFKKKSIFQAAADAADDDTQAEG